MNKFLIFIFGTAVGSLVTWKVVDKYYKDKADEEIKSVVDRFKEMEEELTKNNKIESDKDDSETSKNTVEYDEYKEITKQYVETPEEISELIGPYVISPDEFGEGGYPIETMKYYKDDVLINSDGQIVPDPEALIGDALNHVGEYEEDCVHVRNDEYKTDYEVLISDKTFKEVYNEED